MKEFLECTDQPAMICRWSIKRGEGEERIYLWLSMIKMLEKQDQVINADSAIIFLIIH